MPICNYRYWPWPSAALLWASTPPFEPPGWASINPSFRAPEFWFWSGSGFCFDFDPDAAFHSDVDPFATFQNNADADPCVIRIRNIVRYLVLIITTVYFVQGWCNPGLLARCLLCGSSLPASHLPALTNSLHSHSTPHTLHLQAKLKHWKIYHSLGEVAKRTLVTNFFGGISEEAAVKNCFLCRSILWYFPFSPLYFFLSTLCANYRLKCSKLYPPVQRSLSEVSIW